MGSKDTDRKNNWAAEHTDRIVLALPKGLKEQIREAASNVGESLTTYIRKAVEERMSSKQ